MSRNVAISKSLASILKSKKNSSFSGLDYRVLFTLCERVEANNRIRAFRQSQLAEELGSDQSNISRSLSKLVRLEIIRYENPEYYFDERYVWTGDTQEQN
jgi:DNA-binding MarR family transcriptional regulator